MQRVLNENRTFLPKSAVNSHVKKLNAFDRGAITAEWEIIVLNVLSKIGNLEYEKQFSGSTKPDVFFERGIVPEFIADITTVDDEDYERNNPWQYFYGCIAQYFRKKGVSPRGLHIQIESATLGPYGDRKVRLCLPPKSQMQNFVRKHFHAIIESIKNEPEKTLTRKVQEGRADLTVSYQRSHQFSGVGGGWSSYDIPYSLKKNPIYNRLKQKSSQLKKSGFAGVTGIFLCDGGCSALHTTMRGAGGYSRRDIIGEIFRRNSTLSFIVVLSIEEKHDLFWTNVRRRIKFEFYRNPNAKCVIGRNFREALEKIGDHFPEPEQTPINALSRMEAKKPEGLSYLGGYTMSPNEIQISSRVLTELLAGVINTEKFEDAYGGKDPRKNHMKSFFMGKLFEGKTIREISVVKTAEKDDDRIKITYGHSDPGISKFE